MRLVLGLVATFDLLGLKTETYVMYVRSGHQMDLLDCILTHTLFFGTIFDQPDAQLHDRGQSTELRDRLFPA